jgi:hypothetical protein
VKRSSYASGNADAWMSAAARLLRKISRLNTNHMNRWNDVDVITLHQLLDEYDLRLKREAGRRARARAKAAQKLPDSAPSHPLDGSSR